MATQTASKTFNMAFQSVLHWCIAAGCIGFVGTHQSGAQVESPIPVLSTATPEKGLFETDDVLHIALSGSIRSLLSNRLGTPKNHALVLAYTQSDSSQRAIPVEVRTRGHFRRLKGNCAYPPLLIQFSAASAHLTSVFREQKKLKLVMPCKDDQYVVREWLVYKLYNLVTPKSFRARLVSVTLDDEKSDKKSPPFYGILLEEENQMAKRNLMVAVERKIKPMQARTHDFLTMAVFEYLIGNTDWSVQYQQNIKLLAADSAAFPSITVPYDFDHAGIVDAPYAYPAEELKMKSLRERRYRGYCLQDMKVFESVIAKYNQLKPDIYRTYTDCHLLDKKYVQSTIHYLDEFYATIQDPKLWQKEFAYPCDPGGTGNVVIKGLKKD